MISCHWTSVEMSYQTTVCLLAIVSLVYAAYLPFDELLSGDVEVILSARDPSQKSGPLGVYRESPCELQDTVRSYMRQQSWITEANDCTYSFMLDLPAISPLTRALSFTAHTTLADMRMAVHVTMKDQTKHVVERVLKKADSVQYFQLSARELSRDRGIQSIAYVSLSLEADQQHVTTISSLDLVEKPGSITGTVREDCNCDGAQSNDESGYGNFQISAKGLKTGTGHIATTQQSGLFQFDRLEPDTYEVAIVYPTFAQFCPTQLKQYYVEIDGNTAEVNFSIQNLSGHIVCPANATMICNGSSPAVSITGVPATETCTTHSTISFYDTLTTSSCETTVLRTWQSETGSYCTQEISMVYAQPPIISIPIDVVGFCDGGVSQTGTASCLTACGSATVSFSDESHPKCDDFGNVNTEIQRTWTCTDTCGNMSSGVQTILCL